jgi:O-antigen ligase
MVPTILLALWAFSPSMPFGFLTPKIGVMAAGAVAYALRSKPRALALLAVLVASTLTSIDPSVSFYGYPGFWTYGLLPVAFFCLLTTIPTGKAWLKWAGVALSVHALAQVAGLDPFIPAAKLQFGRAVAFNGSPVDLGAILAMAAPLAGGWLPLILAGIWATGSRGALLAVAFAMGSKRVRLLLLPLLFVPLFLTAPKDVARIEMYKMAWRGFLERPFLGNGPNTFAHVFVNFKTPRLVSAVGDSYLQQHAHNDILEALCSVGLLGLAAYLFMVWPMLRSPSLLALFVILKYNPVSFEVLCVAALIAGQVDAPEAA